MKEIIVSMLIIFISASAAFSDSISVPLPDLLGVYTTTAINERMATIQLSHVPDTIYGLSIRICGTLDLGCYTCDMAPGDFSIGLDFYASLADTSTSEEWTVSDEYFTGSHTCDYGEIEVSERIFPFSFTDEVNWEFMSNGSGTITIRVFDQSLPIPSHCWYIEHASLEITCCEFVIEGSPDVSLESNSWGSIKTLFDK